jgi:hypothetical protein
VISQEFPNSFVKDNAIMSTIGTRRIALTAETVLLLKNAPDGIITGNTQNAVDVNRLKVSIDSGSPFHFVLVPALNIRDTTKDHTVAPKKRLSKYNGKDLPALFPGDKFFPVKE